MEIAEKIFLGILGLAGGFSISGGVFTALLAIGLIPRFAGKTHTARHILLYEEMVVFGTITGGLFSVYKIELFGPSYPYINMGILILTGIFSGIFVGCLALAIAEMLDSIPIFARRSNFKRGIGIAVLAMAVGKTIGSLIYFYNGFYQ